MEAILATINAHRAGLKNCKLYTFMADPSIDPRQRIAFAPHVAFFSMSFGDLMTTVLRRRHPATELDVLVNAHCSEDDFHWRWYLQDLAALGYDDRFDTASRTCEHLWSPASAPVRHLIYAVVQFAGRSSDPLFHLILIEILEAGLSDFFEHSYQDIALQGLPFLKYFGETHYRAEYAHSVTSWFQVDHDSAVMHPLAKYTPSDEVRQLSSEACEVLFRRFHEMYDFWYQVASGSERARALLPEILPHLQAASPSV